LTIPRQSLLLFCADIGIHEFRCSIVVKANKIIYRLNENLLDTIVTPLTPGDTGFAYQVNLKKTELKKN
jgi:hypothetical protein